MAFLKLIVLNCTLTFMLVANAALSQPPNNGKYFFADIFNEGDDYQHALYHRYNSMSWLISNSTFPTQKLGFNTNSQELMIYEKKCSVCGNQATYDIETSTTVRHLKGTLYPLPTWVYAYYKITPVISDSLNAVEEFKLQVNKYSREVQFDNLRFRSVQDQSTNGQQQGHWNGYFGFAPYSDDPELRNFNFMWQLKDQGFIDHNVISFFITDNTGPSGNSSYVQIGNWDVNSLEPVPNVGSVLYMFQTVNTTVWHLNSNTIAIGGNPAPFSGQNRHILFNPHSPYLYMPIADWKSITQELLGAFSDESLTCEDQQMKCYFPNSCDKVIKGIDPNYTLAITLEYDYVYHVSPNQMLVLDPEAPDQCGLAIMPSHLDNQEWVLGSLFMQEHYFVFDMTPKDEQGLDYIQIGIADKNHEDKVLSTHYSNANDIDSSDISYSIAVKPPKPGPHSHNFHIFLIVGLIVLFILIIVAIICFRKYAKKTDEEIEAENKLKSSEREQMIKGIGDSEISKSGLTSSAMSQQSENPDDKQEYQPTPEAANLEQV